MGRIKNPGCPPQGGWLYTVPETGHTVRGGDPRALVSNVVRHYRGNGLPVPEGIAAKVETALCASGHVKCEEEAVGGWVSVKRGTRALVSALASFAKTGESPIVEQSLAEKRAEICSRCPLNRPSEEFCQTCSASAALLSQLFRKAAVFAGGRAGLRTTRDSRLHSCHECGCELRLKVHVKLSALPPSPAGLERRVPAECWQIKDPT